MVVTAWNGGNHLASGGGYGVKLRIADRDRYFERQWQTVQLTLEGELEPVEVNIDKPSFWNDTCHELISRRIGIWLIERELAPWPKGQPPKLLLEPEGTHHFKLRQQPIS